MTRIQELELGLFHAHVSRFTSYAGVCLLVYDHLLTFSDEVHLIWNRPFSIVSILFLINRYTTPLILAVDIYDKGGLTETLDTEFCKIWFIAEGYMNFLLFATIHCLMVMRVNALYGNRRSIRNLLCAAYAVYFIATFAIVTPGMFQAVKTFYAENQFLHVCWGQLTDYFWLTWVPALTLETLIFVLTAYKAWSHSKESLDIPIAKTLYRDGFQYFIVISLCTLFPLLVWTKAPSTLDAMPKYASMGIVTTMGCRLVLNLRRHRLEGVDESYEMPRTPTVKSSPFTFSDIRPTQTIGSSSARPGKSTLTFGDGDSYLDYEDNEGRKIADLKPVGSELDIDLERTGVIGVARNVPVMNVPPSRLTVPPFQTRPRVI